MSYQKDLNLLKLIQSLSLLVFAMLTPLSKVLAEDSQGTGKSGKDYVSIGLVMNEFRSVTIPMKLGSAYLSQRAQTYGVSIAYGSYIDDYFKVELRAGQGIRDDRIKNTLDVNMAYWFSWFLGYQHPITDYMSGYAMYGFSYYEADETRREAYRTVTSELETQVEVLTSPSDSLEPGLFGTKFSQSWALGLEFSLTDSIFLAVEYGRLLNDTDNNIKVRQAGTHLRYEF